MGARHKLNASYFNGILILAGFLALVTQSWRIFLVVAVALLVTSILSGDIRLSPRK